MEKINNIIIKYLNNEITMINLLNMFYDIGELIIKKNVDLIELELYLKNKYGIIISFTKRNFKNMILLYNKYEKNELEKLKEYDWNQIIQILKKQKVNKYQNNNTLNEIKNLKNML